MADLREVLRELNIPVYENGADRGFIVLNCPYCGIPGKPGLGIHERGFGVVCWKCGTGKWLPRVLSDASGQPISVVLKLLGDFDDFIPGRDTVKANGKYTPPPDLGELQPAHVRYLKDTRRRDPEEMKKIWGIGGIGISAEYQWRIWVPVIRQGRPVSWSTRAISDKVSPKYLHAKPSMESMKINDTVFGLDYVRHAVMIVEGWMDAFAIGPGAGAIYGLRGTERWQQLLLLSKVPVRYICLDAEPEAQRRAQGLAANLSVFPGVTKVICLETGKDAAACSETEIKELRKLLE